MRDGSGLADATFAIKDSEGNHVQGSPVTTGGDGTACVDELFFGDYTVQETAAPSGYAIDDDTAHTVTVDNVASCEDDPYVGEEISFTDTPLSRITVSFESLAAGNPTSATIECTGDSAAEPLPEGTPRVLNDLPPGTYTCTVVVDP